MRFPAVLLVTFVLMVLLAPASLSAPPSPTPVPPQPFAFTDRYPAEVTLTSPAMLSRLVNSGVDVADVRALFPGHSFPAPDDPFEPLVATVYVNSEEARRLADLGLVVRPIPNPGPEACSGWPTYAQFVSRMQAIATAHPDIVRMTSIGQSVQGRELWVLEISDNPDVEENEPEFRYVSTMHGVEGVGTETTIRLAELLTDNYGTDPYYTMLVDEMEIWLWPIFNPDGYEACTYANAHGVNLNRNFPDRFNDPLDDPTGREPETQAAMNWVYGHRFVMGANYHTGARVVNIPWDATAPSDPPANPPVYAPDDAIFYEYGVGYAQRNSMIWNGGFPNGITRGWAWYQIWGGMQDWAYHWHSEQHVTIELSDSQPPPYSQMDTYWEANRAAMLWWMERVLTGARGLVTDANTGAPLDATVDVVQIGKPVRTDPDVGDYHRMLLPGSYTLVASAYCYEPQSAEVTVISGTATVQDFALVPAGHWTVQGTVTEAGTGRPLAATIEILGAPITATTNPATGHYALGLCAGTYTMSVSAPQHRPQERPIVVDGDQVQDFSLEPSPCTLLVDDDEGQSYQTYYQNALTAAGQEYETWTVTAGGSPTAADLAHYGRVVWLTGNDYDTTLTSADQAALATYLDGGGRLFISGQDIGYDIRTSAFYGTYLHAQYVADDTDDTTLTGLGFLSGADVTIAGGDGADNQTYPSQINPINGSSAVYQYSPSVYGAVAYSGTHRVVYFAFGFEGINNQPSRTEVMSRTLAWLGGCELPQPEYGVVAADSERVGAPGATVTHTLVITNTGTVSDSYDVALTPGDWPATLLDAQVGPLQPLASGQARVVVHIPAQPATATLLASDVFTLAVTSQADPQANAQAHGSTHAVADLSLTLTVEPESQAGTNGQTVTYTLFVTNSGDYTDTYALSVSGNTWATFVSPAQTPPLGPGEVATTWVAVNIPSGPVGAADTATVRATSGWNAQVYGERALTTTRAGWSLFLPVVLRMAP